MILDCLYVPVNSCKGEDVCLHWDNIPERTIFIVRGSEMFALRLPQLPPPDKSIGTGTSRIEDMLGGQPKTVSTESSGGGSVQASSSKEGG
jgi:hypothetical protein